MLRQSDRYFAWLTVCHTNVLRLNAGKENKLTHQSISSFLTSAAANQTEV